MEPHEILEGLRHQGLPEEEVPVAQQLVRRFHRNFGRWPDLSPPSGFVEWMLHRLIFDRDPRLTVLADKVAMRAHVRAVLGHDPTLPLLQVHEDAARIDWESLPPACFLKASHGSGWNIRVGATRRADRAAITARLNEWLGRCMWRGRREWAYRDVPPRVIAEPLLRNPGFRRPDEICIYCFGGVPQYIRVNRFPGGAETTTGCFDSALRLLALYAEPATAPFPEGIDPAPLLAMACRLSAGLTFLRVDFMVGEGRAWLGELTNYPGGGRTSSYRDDAADELVGTLYAAAHRGAPAPFMLDGREHFREPAAPGGLTARPVRA